MKATSTELGGALIIEPPVHADDRGFFTELYHSDRYRELGIPPFVQDNLAGSNARVLRGLHFQWPRPQGKLVYALEGAILDVAVDIRSGSATFGRWVAVELSAENRRQLYVPEGFAHGYAVLGDRALVAYKCTELYAPEHDRAIRWNDPDIGIEWPYPDPVVSAKDRAAPLLAELPPDARP